MMSAMKWYPRWDEHAGIAVDGGDHLAQLVADLANYDRDEFGGVKRADGTGRWAQVTLMAPREYLVELHPEHPVKAPNGKLQFDSVMPVDPREAGRIAWNWVKNGER